MTRPPEQRLLTEANADTVVAAHATDTGSALGMALNATFVRFVDLAGNPITARHVTIKVDTSTWEINDIIAEA